MLFRSFAALEGLSGESLAALHAAPTVEAALAGLAQADPLLAQRLRDRLAAAIEARTLAYLGRHGTATPQLGAVLFDRGRHIRAAGPVGALLLRELRGCRDGGAP